MKLILDTSAYSAFNRGDERLKPLFRSENEIVVPLMAIGELRAGFAAGNKRAVNEGLLQRFLESPNVSTSTLTDKTSRLFAEVYWSLRRAGTPMGTNDMWIAASTLELESRLMTLNKDFSRVPGLEIAEF